MTACAAAGGTTWTGDSAPRLALCNIEKRYGELLVNNNVSLEIDEGEIHGLIGENGAGKSTLMKIVCGVVQPDAGEIFWNGEEVRIAGPREATQRGIGMIFQHFALFETMTVLENIALSAGSYANLSELAERIGDLSTRHGFPVDPRRLVHNLSVGERQRVEIIRCLLQKPKLLMMDEPTSVLTPKEATALFETLFSLADEGVSILYISHKLDEIRRLADRATIMRSGKVVDRCAPADETAASLAKMMVGDEREMRLRANRAPGETRLVISDLNVQTKNPFGMSLDAIDLTLRSGEIVGVAGISGNGQDELLAALSGQTRVRENSVSLLDRRVGHLGPDARRKLGLAYVSADRNNESAIGDMNLSDNVLLTALGKPALKRQVTAAGLTFRAGLERAVLSIICSFDVKCAGPGALARSLSGGNLQKFVVGRESLLSAQVLIVAQPTWGVDVDAARLIQNKLIEMRDDGMAILLVSDDLDELLLLSDRLCVIASGRLSPLIARQSVDLEQLGMLMAGQPTDTIKGRLS